MKERAIITKRIEPCNCGCRGRDPWHRREYSRTIRDVREERGTAVVTAYAAAVEYRRTGTARLPWGETRVVEVTKGETHAIGWFIAKESMLDALDGMAEPAQ